MNTIPKICVFVNGGMVQGVLANSKVRVMIIDSDIENCDDPDSFPNYVDSLGVEEKANGYEEDVSITPDKAIENFNRLKKTKGQK